jgi:hypothetical protein
VQPARATPGQPRGVWFQLYLVLDIFSRYVVAWTVQATEDSEIAKTMLEQAMGVHGIPVAVHADRDTSMMSEPVAQLLLDLGVDRSHSRPRVSNDNPYSEAAFKTLKYAPVFPENFGSLADARAFCEAFFGYYNHSTATQESGCTPQRQSTTAPRPRSASSVSTPSTQPTPRTRSGSATDDPKHPNCPRPPGSTSPHQRPSYRPRNETCLRLLDIFRSDAKVPDVEQLSPAEVAARLSEVGAKAFGCYIPFDRRPAILLGHQSVLRSGCAGGGRSVILAANTPDDLCRESGQAAGVLSFPGGTPRTGRYCPAPTSGVRLNPEAMPFNARAKPLHGVGCRIQSSHEA